MLTYRVPAEIMCVGAAFDALEKSRSRFRIGEYAVSQPTLEQVFVQTVLANSESERDDGRLLSKAAPESHVSQDLPPESNDLNLEDMPFSGGLKTECCGLNRRSHRFLATSSGLFAFFLFLTVSGFLGPPKWDYGDCHREPNSTQPCAVAAFYNNAVVFAFAFVVSVVGCCGCCFCIPKNPEEED